MVQSAVKSLYGFVMTTPVDVMSHGDMAATLLAASFARRSPVTGSGRQNLGRGDRGKRP